APVDDLLLSPDFTVPGSDLAMDLQCSTACTGICGLVNGCGTTCCAGSGCTPATCDPQCSNANACGSACMPSGAGTPCHFRGPPPSCRAGVCTNVPPSYSVFNDTGTPGAFTLAPDADELGMHFTYDRVGKVLKVRFLKPSGATGPHTGHLWDNGGT